MLDTITRTVTLNRRRRWSAVSALMVLWVLGCNDRVGVDPPPLPKDHPSAAPKTPTTDRAPADPPPNEPPQPVKPPPAAMTPPPTTPPPSAKPMVRARFLLEAPDREPTDPMSLKRRTATVKIGDQEPATTSVMNRRLARQGMAILLVLPMPATRPGWKDAIRDFVDNAGPWDTIAVGVIEPAGFRMVQSFSADPLSVPTAVGGLPVVDTTEAEDTLRAKIPTHRGLLEALESFKKGQLPQLRSLVMLSDGRDLTVRRSSALDRVEAFIRQRAEAFGVRLSLVSLTALTEAHPRAQRMAALVRASGGDAAATDGTPEQLSQAWTRLARSFDRWVVVEHSAETYPNRPVPVTVSVDFIEGRVTATRELRLPAKRRLGVRTYDVALPKAPEVVMPPGVDDGTAVMRQAEQAQTRGDWLEAGALWHLAALAMPEDRKPTVRATLMDASFHQSPRLPGTAIYRGESIPIGIKVQKMADVFPTIWRDVLRSERPPTNVLQAPNPAPEALPPNQLVLWTSPHPSPKACARSLLAAGRATHLFIADDGTVSQLADLGARVVQPETASKRAIHVHVYAPHAGAPTWHDPADIRTWRRPRLRQRRMEINDVRSAGWTLTLAQSEALTRLVAGLTRRFERIKPVFPVQPNGKPALELVLAPEKYLGLLNGTNLDETAPTDLARALDIPKLNITIQRYSVRTKTTDMEEWLDDLGHHERIAGAVARFAHVGPPAIPLLTEAATELSADKGAGAVRATIAIGGPGVVAALAKTADLGVGESPNDDATKRALYAAQGLVQFGDRSHLATLKSLAESARSAFPGTTTASHFRTLYVGLATAVADKASLPLFDAVWTDSDAGLRAQAVLAWSRMDRSITEDRLRSALTDPSPWVRLYAARALGPQQRAELPKLVKAVGLRPVVSTLCDWQSDEPLNAALDWYQSAPPTIQDRLGDAFIRWKWRAAVLKLAPTLRNLGPADKERTLRVLRGIVGRDFGSAPDRYLQWARS